MRKSTSITLTVLAGLMLTSCCINMAGCGRAQPDRTWYDASGNVMQEKWKTDEAGNKMLDTEGRPIPDPHVPFDSHHRSWVFTNGEWAPLSPPVSSSSYSRSSRSYGSSSSYRSTSTTPLYRSSSGSSTSTSSSRSSSSSSSISRGGFGSTGMGSSS